MFRRLDNRGVTLISLIISIVVIGIMISMGSLNMSRQSRSMDVYSLGIDKQVLESMIKEYHSEHGKLPFGEKLVPTSMLNAYIQKEHGVTVDHLYKINEEEIEELVQPINGNIQDYGFSGKGPTFGKVFHLNGVELEEGFIFY